MARYKFLTDTGITPLTIWAWAKQLVQDLNKQDAALSGIVGGIPSGVEMIWSRTDAPVGWLICNGGEYLVSDYPNLFNVLGYDFGGSGATFNVPDRRNRILMGAGDTVPLNGVAGAATVELAEDNLPAHIHGVTDPSHTHVFAGTAHGHAVTDPGHAHGVTDPGHVHAGGAAAVTASMTAGAANNVAAQANTANAVTGLTVNNAVTGLTVNNATAGGDNAPSATGISVDSTGGGVEFSVLNPVVGVNVIIKA